MPAMRWETQVVTALVFYCRACATLPRLAGLVFIVGVIRVICTGLCAARRFRNDRDKQGCKMGSKHTVLTTTILALVFSFSSSSV